MDVGELLSFQPDKPVVKSISAAAAAAQSSKRKRRLEEDLPVKTDDERKEKKPNLNKEERENIAKILETEDNEVEALDETSLKRLLLTFEKRVYRNQEMRIKFPDLPEKFMESEMELNETIMEMHIISTAPELYHVLVDLNTIQTLLQLLNHDNTDVSIAVVELLEEMTDIEAVDENEEDAAILVDALLGAQVMALLVQNMERLDESIKEESDGIHNSLAILENMIELRPDVCVDAAQQGFLEFILKRIKAKIPFEQNRLYCSELLSILLQTHDENRQMIGELEGIDVLLQQLALYKRRDPSSDEEIEMMENLFDGLCSSLMHPSNKARFLKGEGLQLMNLMLREKKMSRTSALKVLNHSMNGPEGVNNCNKFVDILGLSCIFPLFMKTPKAHKKAGPNKQEIEEHIVSIISSLVKNCDGTQRQRLINKFTENDHEKVDRLMELHFKYLTRVHAADEKIEAQKKEVRQSGSEITDEMEDEFYLKRLEAGLFTLQQVDYIMLDLCHSCPSAVRLRVLQILNLRGGSIKTIKSIMREYAGSIGDAVERDVQRVEQERILQLVDRF